MIDTQDFLNPFLETLPCQKLVEIELKNFRRYLQYAKEHSGFYRKTLANAEPDHVRQQGVRHRVHIIWEDTTRLPERLANSTSTLQKSRMPQILGVAGEAVVRYREPSTTQEMRYPRVSLRVNKMALSSCCQDATYSGFQKSIISSG